LQTELASKLRAAGVGLGLVTLGVTLLTLFFTMLVVALILGLATIMEPWVAALLVAGIVLVTAVVMIGAGIASIAKGFTPFETVDQIVDDFRNLGKDKSRG
jgi:formate hydrogenlyase subunit 4